MVGEISMKYIAHCDEGREQSILDHLQGTAEKARGFAEVFGKGDWGYCCGMLHDIGKYSDKFQRRIHGEEIKVDHATAGESLSGTWRNVSVSRDVYCRTSSRAV